MSEIFSDFVIDVFAKMTNKSKHIRIGKHYLLFVILVCIVTRKMRSRFIGDS